MRAQNTASWLRVVESLSYQCSGSGGLHGGFLHWPSLFSIALAPEGFVWKNKGPLKLLGFLMVKNLLERWSLMAHDNLEGLAGWCPVPHVASFPKMDQAYWLAWPGDSLVRQAQAHWRRLSACVSPRPLPENIKSSGSQETQHASSLYCLQSHCGLS